MLEAEPPPQTEAEARREPHRGAACRRGTPRDAFEMLGGYTIEAKVRGVLFGLGFTEADMARLTSEFSGGWQMRIALTKLLIRNPGGAAAR